MMTRSLKERRNMGLLDGEPRQREIQKGKPQWKLVALYLEASH